MLLNLIITGVETWVHHFTPEQKEALKKKKKRREVGEQCPKKSESWIICQEDHGICLLECIRNSPHGCAISRDSSWSSSRHSPEEAGIAWWKCCCSFLTMFALIWRRQPWHYSGSSDGRFFHIRCIRRTSHPVITGCSWSWKPTLLDSILVPMKKWKQQSIDLLVIVRKTSFLMGIEHLVLQYDKLLNSHSNYVYIEK